MGPQTMYPSSSGNVWSAPGAAPALHPALPAACASRSHNAAQPRSSKVLAGMFLCLFKHGMSFHPKCCPISSGTVAANGSAGLAVTAELAAGVRWC